MIKKNGSEFARRCPKCQKEKLLNRAKKFLEVGGILLNGNLKSFNDFDFSVNQISEEIKVIQDFPLSPQKKLFVCAKTGTGKTMAALALFMDLIMKGENAFFITARKLKRVIGAYSCGDLNANEILDDVQYSTFLFIDDIGAEPRTESEQFETTLEEIIENHNGKIIFTSNKTPIVPEMYRGKEKDPEVKEKLKVIMLPYAGRLLSRMQYDMKFVSWKGVDYRTLQR
jgi:DNA replication protein DnaC